MERRIESVLRKFKSVFHKSKPKDPFFADRSVYRSSDLLRIKSLYEVLSSHKIAGEIIAGEWAWIVGITPKDHFKDFRLRDPLLTLKMLYDSLVTDRSAESLRFLSRFIADYMGFGPNFTFYNW